MSFVPLKIHEMGKKETEDVLFCCYHQLHSLLFVMEVRTNSEVAMIVSCYPGVSGFFLIARGQSSAQFV